MISDYIHVMDLAQGHLAYIYFLMSNNSQFVCMNLAIWTGYRVLEFINTFEKVNKISIPYVFSDRRMGDVPFLVADNSLALSALKWSPQKNLNDICKDGWEWQRMNPAGYDN